MGRLIGKRCIITGSGSGMGRAAALLFAREAGHVALLDHNESSIVAVRDQILAAGGKALAVRCDVSDPTSIQAAIARSADEMQGIDVCWANAGTGDSTGVIDTAIGHWDHVIAINLTGMFLTSKYVLPHMIAAGGGSLILTSSSGVLKGVPGAASAMAAKGGVLGLVRQMSAEYIGNNIRVNAICPGAIETPALVDSMAEHDRRAGQPIGTMMDYLISMNPRGRIGQPEDIAGVALFLASDESAWVSAQFINVSGTGH